LWNKSGNLIRGNLFDVVEINARKGGDPLLTALKDDGSLICLAELQNFKYLQALRQKGEFYCPGCKEKMILKIGTKKISHFAHYRGSSCSEQFERESEYHLLGKQKLYLWLKEKGLQPELEAFDQQIRQRPDIRFTYENIRYALEFQCSTIPDEVFFKRTQCYQQNDYTPLWILGGNFLTRKNSAVVSLSDFQYQCIKSAYDCSTLSFYCPNTNQAIFLQKVIPITTRHAIATIAMGPLQNLDVKEFIQPHTQIAPTLETWRKEMKTFKYFYTQKPQAYKDPFLKELYQKHIHLAYLPPEVGLPVANGIFIRTPQAVWQGFLYVDCFHHRSLGDIISYHQIYQAFKARVWKGHISLRVLPLLTNDASAAVLEYLQLLVNCSYLVKTNQTTYKINRKLLPNSNMVQQEQNEALFYQQNKTILHFFR
jgi:competence protein CoiA